jgi:hypothetical protein
LAAACPYYTGTYSTIVTSKSPTDATFIDTTATKTLSWGPTSGFLHTTAYIIVITGTMQNPNTYTYTMTLTLNVQGICEGTTNAPGISMNSDWYLLIGDVSFPYDQSAYLFSCPAFTVTPTYTVTVTDSRFIINNTPTTKTVSWSISSFSADATFTVTATGVLPSPHT